MEAICCITFNDDEMPVRISELLSILFEIFCNNLLLNSELELTLDTEEDNFGELSDPEVLADVLLRVATQSPTMPRLPVLPDPVLLNLLLFFAIAHSLF
jgi:hypothetical protein